MGIFSCGICGASGVTHVKVYCTNPQCERKIGCSNCFSTSSTLSTAVAGFTGGKCKKCGCDGSVNKPDHLKTPEELESEARVAEFKQEVGGAVGGAVANVGCWWFGTVFRGVWLVWYYTAIFPFVWLLRKAGVLAQPDPKPPKTD